MQAHPMKIRTKFLRGRANRAMFTYLAALLLIALPAKATISIVSSGSSSASQYSLVGSNYTQTFDTLANSSGGYSNGTSATWTNNATLPGWYIGNNEGNASVSLLLQNGSSNPTVSGGTSRPLSLGANNDSDRALGVHTNNSSVVSYIGLGFTNNSGSTLNSFTIGYTGEQWREATTQRTQSFTLQYLVGATLADLTSATNWTTISGGGFASDQITTVSNSSLLYTATLSNLTVDSLSVESGSSIWFRWMVQTTGTTNNSQDVIGIDNVSVSFAAIPEPSTYALAIGALALGLAAYRRRRVTAK